MEKVIARKRAFADLTAADLMVKEVYFYHEGVSTHQLATTMTEERFGSLPIVDEETRLMGIVSEFDLLEALRAGKDLRDVTAEEVMTATPVFVREETTAAEIMGLLQERHLIRLPVIDARGRLVGIVARQDVLSGYLASL